MRPIKLTMTAFGPYENTQVIDFNELNGEDFFLIHGVTGAGKTSILDAICFALYGKTSDDKREASMLRNSKSDLALITSVELCFSLGQKTYRVKHSPEQMRLSKRASKSDIQTNLVKESASAELYQINGDREELLVDGKDNVSDKIRELIGFEIGQFRQVVLLPQGKFREMLVAKSQDRQSLMENLFKTHIYHEIEEELKKRAKKIKDEYDALTQQEKNYLSDAKVGTIAELQGKINSLENEICDERKKSDILLTENQAKMAALTEGEKIFEAFSALDKAEKKEKELGEQKEQNEALAKRLEISNRAGKLSDVATALMQSELEASEKEIALKNCNKELEKADDALKQANQAKIHVESRQAEYETLVEKARLLKQYAEQIEGMRSLAEDIKKAENEENTSRAKEGEIRANRQVLEEKLKDEIHERDEKNIVVAKANEISLRLEKLESEKKNRSDLKRLEQQLAVLLEEGKNKSEVLKNKQSDLEREKEALNSIIQRERRCRAAILAKGLQEGEACPVCGSKEHPLLAIVEEALPTEEEIKIFTKRTEDIEKDFKQAEEIYIKARDDYKACKTRKEEKEKSIGDLTENLDDEILKLKQEVQNANNARIRVEELNKHIKIHTEKEAELKETLESIAKKLEECVRVATELKGQQKEKMANIPPAYRAEGAAQREYQQHTAKIKQMEDDRKKAEENYRDAENSKNKAVIEKENAGKNLKEASDKKEKARKIFSDRMIAEGFESIETYQEALAHPWNDRAYREKVERELSLYKEEVLRVGEQVSIAKQAVEGKTLPDMDMLKKEANKAHEAYAEAMAKAAALDSEHKNLEHKKQIIEKLMEDSEKLRNEYRVVGYISDVANGDNKVNSKGMTFERYILRALLGDVLRAANERLFVMSRGRYRLSTADRIKKNQQGGLDIEVYDEDMGTSRPVATLSGGESFIAALSLALGLADVVRDHAGGIRMDTMFIDEGFGSLDSESLEVAIEALLDLQRGGRLVGIISHVEDLKKRIRTQLAITKTTHGSTAKFKIATTDT